MSNQPLLLAQVYGNCCDDYTEFCGEDYLAESGVLQTSMPLLTTDMVNKGEVNTVCLGRSLVISSCSPRFDRLYFLNWKQHWKDSFNHRSLADHLSTLQEQDVIYRCLNPTVDGADYLRETPVSANDTGLHFRNVYCALCNGLTSAEFWLGFSVCRPLNLLEDDSASDLCSTPMVFLPSGDQPNSCFLSSELVPIDPVNSATDGRLEADTENGGNTTAEPARVFPPDNRNVTISNISSGGYPDELGSDLGVGPVWEGQDQPELYRRCHRLVSYVLGGPRSEDVYRNVYCYRLQHAGQSPPRLCEPGVRRLPLVYQGRYVTFVPEIKDKTSNASDAEAGGKSGTVELAMGMQEDIEVKFLYKLISSYNKPSCDTATSLLVNGQCLRVAFFLHIFVTYNYERSSLIKGNYRESAESYTRFVSDTMTSPISPRFFCEAINMETTEVSGREHEGELQLRCVEMSISALATNSSDQFNGTETDPRAEPGVGQNPQTVNGEPVNDQRVRGYLDFATKGFHAIHAGTGVMKLPGTVDIRVCLTDMLRSDTLQVSRQFHDYCASYKLRWQAQANIDGVVGEISLEGIITIICCILSDIGLLVRLALQQVVPFYKTYPAKVQFSLCLALLLAYTLFLVGGMVDEGSRACRIISTMTHLAFLSALFWMNVTAFEIWRTFRHWRNQVVSRGRTSLVLSALYAVGIPLAIVISALVIEELYPWSEFSPNYGEYFCWLNGSMAVAIFFVTPCSAICGMNAVFVGLTLRGLRRQRTSISEFKKSNTETAITDTTIVVKIILLVGITWLLGLLAAMVNHQVLWIIFTVINASLGFLISAVLVLNKRVFYAVQKKCLCYSTDSITVVSTQVPRH
ncbi:hypothetical protein EGW08_005451 [Elysia chlorotica]|uniref:G-protein coupled receptors family 2 profile 2 domain-containing protein n=1 Tax=Elysia chlorotica TaxID=188477 RepID=A0A433TZ09_ELYCH|nr:hypothetical protein EGW08_005451 [Elysia chlorotica]